MIMPLKKLCRIPFRKRISNWWDRRGNKGLPSWYFYPPLAMLLGYLMYFSVSLISYAGIKSIFDIILLENLQTITSILKISFYVTLTTINIVLHYIILAYARKRAAFTFKTKPKLRVTLLKRKRFGDLFFYLFSIFLLSSVIFFAIFFQIEYLNSISRFAEIEIVSTILEIIRPIFQEYFPLFLTYTIFFRFLEIFTGNGLKSKQELIYIIHSLEKFTNKKQTKNYEELKEDDEYLISKFVTKFEDTLLYSMDAIDEVNLGSQLSQILLARSMGTVEEKKLAKSYLSELRANLKNKSWKSKVVNWLQNLEESFPRFSNLTGSILIKSKSSKGRTRIRENMIFFATIGALIVAVIDFFLYLMHP